MDVYQTEEEQVESIKKWWAENSRAIFFGIGLGLLGLFAWQNWKDEVHTQAVEASDRYMQLEKAVKESQFDEALLLAAELETSYADTPYAAIAGLQAAKIEMEKGEREAAIKTLEKVAAAPGNNSIQHVARIRSFRIRIGLGELSEVIADINVLIAGENGTNPGEFIGQYQTLKGDSYHLLNQVEPARSAYKDALKTATIDSRLIQLKLDDLGPAPAGFANDSSAAVSLETKK